MDRKRYLSPQSTMFFMELENMIATSGGDDDDYAGNVVAPDLEWGAGHKDGWSSEDWSNAEE